MLPIYKKDDDDNKENYHPVNSLSNNFYDISKIIYNHINQHMKKNSQKCLQDLENVTAFNMTFKNVK